MIARFCDWLAATPLSIAFQNAEWFVPLVQTVHILAIAVMLTSVGILSFRLIVPSADADEHGLSDEWVPWTWSALVVLLLTGTLLTITEPSRELLNMTFRVKMLLVLVMSVILMALQTRQRGNAFYWVGTVFHRRIARCIGIVCLLLGVGIVTAGRWIAYS